MRITRLAWKNITGRLFRSGAIFLAAILVASLAVCTTLIVRGAEDQLHRNLERLGADIIVLPWGTVTENVKGAQMVSIATERWMPAAYLNRLAAVSGVKAVSPQLYITTIEQAPFCSQQEVLLVAFDPATDITVWPWLEQPLDGELGLGEFIGGNCAVLPVGDKTIDVRGYELSLRGRLISTGTDMDRTLFVTFETAEDLVRYTRETSWNPIKLAPSSATSIMLKVDINEDPREVVHRIHEQVVGVVPILTSDFMQTERSHMALLLNSILILMSGTWVLSVSFVGLVFSIAVHERRREIAVLRSLGSPWQKIFWMLMYEGFILSSTGGVLGVLLGSGVMVLFHEEIAAYLGVPFLLPGPESMLGLGLAGFALASLSVFLGALVPAYRITHEEIAVMMRE